MMNFWYDSTFSDALAYNFTLPEALPSGQYLVRIEQIALHVASTFGGGKLLINNHSGVCIDPASVQPNSTSAADKSTSPAAEAERQALSSPFRECTLEM